MTKHIVQLHMAADHPALAGHFPGFPILPGVVLLDEILHAIEIQRAALDSNVASPWHIETIKFHRTALPGEALQLSYESLAGERTRFELHRSQILIASGTIKPRTANVDAEPSAP